MRLMIVAITLSLPFAAATALYAQESQGGEVQASRVERDTVVISGTAFSRRRSETLSTTNQQSFAAAGFAATVTYWGFDEAGNSCVTEVAAVLGSAEEAEAANRSSGQRDWVLPPVCPSGVETPFVLPSPEEVALEFWRQVQLPAPAPAIAPGFAITGKTAYLESNAQPTAPFRFDTPLGPLQIDASAQLSVDWGDGRGPVAYDSLGGPWPDGEVTNVYGDAGVVDVVVTQDWTARWSVAGATGTLGGLRTTGTIPGFEVREVQAVIE